MAGTREDLRFTWDGLELEGTLHVPAADQPCPAVVMMQGSGPADRDSGGYFPQIRGAFLAQGIAAFAFDKPGCGRSSGNWKHYGLEGRSEQSAAAIDVIRSHPAIDAHRVGVFGHSQGGWLAQMLASRDSSLVFAIASAGPSINLPEQDLYGCEHTMRAAGAEEAAITAALAFIGAVHDAARSGLDYETLQATVISPVVDEPWYGSYLSIDDPDDWGLTMRFVREGYEPLDSLSQISMPFLAVFGGRDQLVPAWRCTEEIGRALERAPTTDTAIAVFPEGNHRLQVDEDGPFVTGYLDLLASWAGERV